MAGERDISCGKCVIAIWNITLISHYHNAGRRKPEANNQASLLTGRDLDGVY